MCHSVTFGYWCIVGILKAILVDALAGLPFPISAFIVRAPTFSTCVTGLWVFLAGISRAGLKSQGVPP